MEPFVQTNTALSALHYLAMITAILAVGAWFVFIRFYLHSTNRRRYLGMLIWLSTTTACFVVGGVLRLFFGYRSPTIWMSMSRVVIDIGVFLTIMFAFRCLHKWLRE